MRNCLGILDDSLMFWMFALCFSMLLFDIFIAVVVLDLMCAGRTPKTWYGDWREAWLGHQPLAAQHTNRDLPIHRLSQKPKKFLYSPGNGCIDTLPGWCPGSLFQNLCVPKLSKLPFAPPPNPAPLFSLPAALIISPLPILFRETPAYISTSNCLQVSLSLIHLTYLLSLLSYRFSLELSLSYSIFCFLFYFVFEETELFH